MQVLCTFVFPSVTRDGSSLSCIVAMRIGSPDLTNRNRESFVRFEFQTNNKKDLGEGIKYIPNIAGGTNKHYLWFIWNSHLTGIPCFILQTYQRSEAPPSTTLDTDLLLLGIMCPFTSCSLVLCSAHKDSFFFFFLNCQVSRNLILFSLKPYISKASNVLFGEG